MHNEFFSKKIRMNKNKYNQRKILNEFFVLCFYQSNFSELFFKINQINKNKNQSQNESRKNKNSKYKK